MGWLVANGLDVLLGQLNALAPNRSKVSDGSIGDAAHASRDSDHNPWYVLNGQPLVTARDFTHDPTGGLDGQRLADALVQSRDPRIKYVIWNRRIIDSRPGNHPWQWMPYSGINAHQHHVHVSVVADSRCQTSAPWALPGLTGSGGAATGPDSLPTLKAGDSSSAVASLQDWSNRFGWKPPLPLLTVDGDYGPKTVTVVKAAQAQCGVTGPDANGTIVGPRTKAAFYARGWRG